VLGLQVAIATTRTIIKDNGRTEMVRRDTLFIKYLEAMDYASQAIEHSRAMWSATRLAVLNAKLVRCRIQAETGELAYDERFRTAYRDEMLDLILRAAMAGAGAKMGNIQIFDSKSGRLSIQAHAGFSTVFLDHFQITETGHLACGAAFKSGQRVIVEDTANSEIFQEHEDLEVILDAGVRAVQSTPLFDSENSLIGVLSTHYTVPTIPTAENLKVIDHFSIWASQLIEWHAMGLPRGKHHRFPDD
jgi:hypothetical protein